MSDTLLTCDMFDALLPEHLEGAIDDEIRAAVERHARNCARCGMLLEDLTRITREARALPELAPSRDLWPGIEARIEAPVVSLPVAAPPARERAPALRRWTAPWLGAAAAALVAATASVTYVATRMAFEPARQVATADSVGAPRLGGARTVAVTTPVEQVYDQEIARLSAIVRERQSQLDTATVAVIERNLRIIDRAIAESRAALAKDPNSRLLNDQLNSVLDQKVELLRTVALLPART